MTPKQLSHWQWKMKFNYASASSELGIDHVTWYRYLNGKNKKGIPQHIDLACAAIANGLLPYSETLK